MSWPAVGAARQGGTLRLARVNDPGTLDPTTASSMLDVLLLPLLYQPLIDFSGGASLTNRLVSSWSVSPDRRVFAFDLLPGVRFSNGREAVADDYVFTLERSVIVPAFTQQYALQIKGAPAFREAWTHQAAHVMSPGSSGDAARTVARPHLEGVSAPSRYKLVVELEKSDPTFGAWMANSFGMALAHETLPDLMADVGVHPVGTGPYLVKEWVRGVHLRLERNPNYFRPEEQHFDAIEIMIGGDESTHLMMFERGELDMASLQATGAPEADFVRLHRDPRWKAGWTNAPLFHCIMLNLNTAMPPLDDARVRLALAHAIDRGKFERMNGERVTPGHGGITPAMPGFNPDLSYPGYDPQKSRALLREAGFGGGLPKPLRLWHTNIQLYRRWAAGLQDDFAKAGIAVELQEVSNAAFDSITGRRNGSEMAIFSYNSGTPDASYFLSLYHSRSISDENSLNAAFYRDDLTDRLLDAASANAEDSIRLPLYRQVEQRLVNEGALVVLGHLNLFALRQPWLKGPVLEPMWWFRLDRVWFEK